MFLLYAVSVLLSCAKLSENYLPKQLQTMLRVQPIPSNGYVK